MGAENNEESCLQRDSAEHKGYVRAHRSFNRIWKERDSAEPDLLGKILDKDNLNRAFKRVKANKGAPGVDGMTIDETLTYLREHNHEIVDRIKAGHYTPKPVRRVEIPKPDGGSAKTWHSHRHRPYHTASHGPADGTDLRAAILGKQLWLSAGEKREGRHKEGEGVRRTGIYPCGKSGSI